MNFSGPIKSPVLNRGVASDGFLTEIVAWGRTAPEEIFAPNLNVDIYSKIKPELGPWESMLHRRAGMLEVMRVLGMFESSGNFNEGVDTSRVGSDTAENAEAGAWQVSYDARRFAPELRLLLDRKGIKNGIEFQRLMKSDHPLAMEFVARLMRFTTHHNGPLYKGSERSGIRSSLRGPEHSIYPWIRRDAVAQFMTLLA